MSAVDILLHRFYPEAVWQCEPGKQPVFLAKASLDAPVELVSLRDHPDLFEERPKGTFRLTAKGRDRYEALRKDDAPEGAEA